MKKLIVNKKHNAVRCEICHQSDNLDSDTETCLRCININIVRQININNSKKQFNKSLNCIIIGAYGGISGIICILTILFVFEIDSSIKIQELIIANIIYGFIGAIIGTIVSVIASIVCWAIYTKYAWLYTSLFGGIIGALLGIAMGLKYSHSLEFVDAASDIALFSTEFSQLACIVVVSTIVGTLSGVLTQTKMDKHRLSQKVR